MCRGGAPTTHGEPATGLRYNYFSGSQSFFIAQNVKLAGQLGPCHAMGSCLNDKVDLFPEHIKIDLSIFMEGSLHDREHSPEWLATCWMLQNPC